jgi:hypothetical protein
MKRQPLRLTPAEVRVLVRCPLHYHFLQQKPAIPVDPAQTSLDELVRGAIQRLHAAGGPDRLSVAECLENVGDQPLARQMVERYYHKLERDWPQMMAGNEMIELTICQVRLIFGQITP